MGNFWKRHKLHILWGAGAIALALLAAVLGSMLLRADRMPADVAVADRPFQGVNLTPVALKPSDSAAEGASTGGTGEGEGSGQEPQEQPEQKPQETPETPKKEESDGGDKDKEKDDAPADEDKKDDEKPRMQVVTDLTNKTIAFEELENGKFSFYAYLENPEEGAYLQVRLGNTRCSGSNGRFTVTLAQGENIFTLLVYQNGTVVRSYTKTIVYRAAMADEDNKTVGDDPPVIETNLPDDADYDTSNANFVLTVHAYNSQGTIYHNHIRVLLDGKEITQYTGSETLEYRLYLTAGAVGDVSKHTVEIWAWDDRGNSAYKKHVINYHFKEEGEVIGSVTLRLDATVLGLGILAEDSGYEVKQGQPASYVVKGFLEDNGFPASYSGSLDVGFYLQRIRCSDAFSGAAIPEELQTLLTLDGLTVRQPEGYKDSLGEFDYTQGSGWMCAVNGYYPGRGLSNVFLGDGDVVTIAFTLAYGKDIGGADAANVRGNLRTYCGTWLGDRYIPHHDFVEGKCSICGKAEEAHEHQWTEEVTREATCTDSGEKTLTCGECGETKTESIPALGHDYRSGGVVWEQEGESCTAEFTCTRCGSSGTIHASRADDSLMENGRVEATCGQDGYVSYLAVGSIGGTQVRCEGTVTLPATGEHTYNEDGVCSVCGRKKDEETTE